MVAEEPVFQPPTSLLSQLSLGGSTGDLGWARDPTLDPTTAPTSASATATARTAAPAVQSPQDAAWGQVVSGRVIERGARGPAVRALQQRLRDSGFDLEVDGDFGPKTRRAVLGMQRRLGVQADGDVGPQTSAALDRSMATRRARPGPAAPPTGSGDRPTPTSPWGDRRGRGRQGRHQPTPPAPVVQAPTPAPVVQAPTPAPVVQAPTPAPVVQAPTPAPVVQAPTPAPVVQVPTPAPVVQAPTPAPVVQAPAPVVQAPAPVVAPAAPAVDQPMAPATTTTSPQMQAAIDAWMRSVPESQRTNAEANLPHIVKACAEAGVTDPNQVSYILATAQHESGYGQRRYSRSVALVEDHNPFKQNADGTWSSKNHVSGGTSTAASSAELETQYWNDAYGGRTDLGNRPGTDDGANYRGRGFVQLTGRSNYQAMTTILGEQKYTYSVDGVTYGTQENPIDLLAHPEHVNLVPELAARILVEGSVRGTFTGKSLDDYISGNNVDFVNARRVINGTDRAADVASIATGYQGNTGDWAAAVATPTVQQPGPAGGPVPEVAPPAPVVQAPQSEVDRLAPAGETTQVDPAKDTTAPATGVVVQDPSASTRAQPEGARLSPEAQAAHLAEIGQLTAAKFGEGEVGRGTTDIESAKLVQRTLVELGYLPQGTEIDGAFGPLSTNALMAFQVATSGVDKVEKGTDANGKPIYMTDKDDPRLQGIVTGTLTADTKAKLLAELERQKTSILNDGTLPTFQVLRDLGESPEQTAALNARLQQQGIDPKVMQTLDVAAYQKLGLRPHVLASAIDGWENAYLAGETTSTMITVNDFELPGNMRRSFTIDLSTMGAAPFMQEVVAHGSGSDQGDGSGVWSTKFSGAQTDSSHQSVLGGLIAGGEAYGGSKVHGTVVEGLEQGINDQAEDRLVRTHAPTADNWTSESVIGRNMGYHSWGCIVWDTESAKQYRDAARAAGGLYQFNFAPNEQYWGKNNAVNGD